MHNNASATIQHTVHIHYLHPIILSLHCIIHTPSHHTASPSLHPIIQPRHHSIPSYSLTITPSYPTASPSLHPIIQPHHHYPILQPHHHSIPSYSLTTTACSLTNKYLGISVRVLVHQLPHTGFSRIIVGLGNADEQLILQGRRKPNQEDRMTTCTTNK